MRLGIWSLLSALNTCFGRSLHQSWWSRGQHDRLVHGTFWRTIPIVRASIPIAVSWYRYWWNQGDLKPLADEHGWTIAHFHFLQMGGFTLFDGDKTIGTLSCNHLRILLERWRVNFPSTTVMQIQDLNKIGMLPKLLAIGQTGWFIPQIIARKAYRFAITELEIAISAFAVLSAATYFFWWNKAFDVRRSLPVYLLEGGDKVAVQSDTCKLHVLLLWISLYVGA